MITYRRNRRLVHASALAASVGALLSAQTATAAPTPSKEEMWEIIQKQQKQIESLMEKLGQAENNIAKNEKKVEVTGEMVEQAQKTGGGGLGWWNNTSLGGYGELHYNAMKDDADDEIDFHRFVLFVAHEFNERLRFFSEIELEHALSGEGKNGEVELEQAYVEYDITNTQHAKAGVFLVPVGILNETHEPPTFYGVERNPVEKNIIPTTWWEAGVGLNGELGNGFSYDVAVHSGLSTPTSGSKAFKIRDGRQKVSEAQADKGAVTGRVKWTGEPGIELAVTVQYQQDVAQADLAESVDGTLIETHADIEKNGFGLRALYARWDLDGTAAKTVGRDEQTGWYIEPSYKLDTEYGDLGFFIRYNEYDNEAGLSGDSEFAQTDIGFNYWPHPDVVLKADIAILDNPPGSDDDEILNLGVGFQF